MEEQNRSRDLLAIKKLEIFNRVLKKEGMCILLTIIADHIIAKIALRQIPNHHHPRPNLLLTTSNLFF